MVKPTEVNFFGMNNIITAEDRAGEIEVILKEAPSESGQAVRQ